MNFNEIVETFKNPEDLTDTFDPQDISSNKGTAAVATVPCLFWIPLVTGNSSFAKFYANQGLTTLCLSIVLGIVGAVLGAILGLIPLLGAILSAIIGLIVGVAPLAAFIFTLVNALNGKAKPIPLVGKLINPFQ